MKPKPCKAKTGVPCNRDCYFQHEGKCAIDSFPYVENSNDTEGCKPLVAIND